MGFSTIAILSPGNMGGAVGAQLRKSGYDVISCLAERSDFTRRKADEAGFRNVVDMNALVSEADLVLSILDPAKAMDIADQVASAMKSTGKYPVFADCNATSPATAGERRLSPAAWPDTLRRGVRSGRAGHLVQTLAAWEGI